MKKLWDKIVFGYMYKFLFSIEVFLRKWKISKLGKELDGGWEDVFTGSYHSFKWSEWSKDKYSGFTVTNKDGTVKKLSDKIKDKKGRSIPYKKHKLENYKVHYFNKESEG